MSSNAEISVMTVPVAAMEYRDIAGHPVSDAGTRSGARNIATGSRRRTEVELAEAEVAERITRERAEAVEQTEQRLRQQFESQLLAARAGVAEALKAFDVQRTEYFARVEAEVVQLALAIAAKILHREAQVDPMLVATLVKMTIDKMREGSSVTVRVGIGRAARWKQYFAAQANGARVEITEDATLSDHDCVLETELGVANFGLDTQLKEVEQGFFDLLALRPENR
jgi:flagellar assembly protein FliH